MIFKITFYDKKDILRLIKWNYNFKIVTISTSKNESSASVNSDSKQCFVVILWHGDSCALYYVMWIFLNSDYVTDGNY